MAKQNMVNNCRAIPILIVGVLSCGSCIGQETEWQVFRKTVAENARKIRQLPENSQVEATMELFYIENKRYEMVSPTDFVNNLPSDFDLEAFMMFANVCPDVLPQFSDGLASFLSSADGRCPPQLREWHEETSRLICYRVLSDKRFRASYLRLGAWNSPVFFIKATRWAGPLLCAKTIARQGRYRADSVAFWAFTKEFLCCALTTGYEEILTCELERGTLVTGFPAFVEYLESRSFVAGKESPGWEPSAQSGIGRPLENASEPALPDSPIDDLPLSLKACLPEINAAMDY